MIADRCDDCLKPPGDIRLLVELGELVSGQQRWSELEQFVDLELAGTLVLGRTAATNRFCDAARFAVALPWTLHLLEAGSLFVHQALMVLRKTRNCPEEVSRLVESRVLPGSLGLCPADLGRRVEAEVLKVEGERERLDAERRRAAAVRARRTFVRSEDDGMAVVGGYLPAEQARQWTLELEVLQRQEQVADQAAGVVRTADQRRADVLASLPGIVLAARAAGLLQAAGTAGATGAVGATGASGATEASGAAGAAGAAEASGATGAAGAAGSAGAAGAAGSTGALGAGGAGAGTDAPVATWSTDPAGVAAGCTRQRTPRIVINVHVPMATVLDLSQAPGVMTGYGLISAEHVRGLLPSADLRAIYVDELGGRPISVGAVLRAGVDPTTGRLLPEPAQLPVAVPKPRPTRSHRSTEGRAEPSSGPPQETTTEQATTELRSLGLATTEQTTTGLRSPEQTTTEETTTEMLSPELIGSSQEGELLRDPRQVREVLLAMITPVWAVDRAEPQHDPSAALSRLVDLRDQRCCGPGCSISVGRTQRDHNLRWPEGPTAAWNLSVKSARCHRAKHSGWQVTIDAGGDAHWVSPLGRAYDRISAWDPPPDLSGARVLPPPRAAQPLSYPGRISDGGTLLTAPPLAGSVPLGPARSGPQHPQPGDDLAAEGQQGDEDPPPF